MHQKRAFLLDKNRLKVVSINHSNNFHTKGKTKKRKSWEYWIPQNILIYKFMLYASAHLSPWAGIRENTQIFISFSFSPPKTFSTQLIEPLSLWPLPNEICSISSITIYTVPNIYPAMLYPYLFLLWYFPPFGSSTAWCVASLLKNRCCSSIWTIFLK